MEDTATNGTINNIMDYVTNYYKNLSEELSRKLNLLEAMVAQATSPSPTSAPAGTSPTAPMGPPSPGVMPAPTAPGTPYPPPPHPMDYPGGVNSPEFKKAYDRWLEGFNQLPPDDPARTRYRNRQTPRVRPGQYQRPGGGTVNR